jgi:UDP-N-acetylmuramoylalanine-D-glutamate ligase
MENYYNAKKKLFDGRLGEIPKSSVVNVDDDWGRRLTDELKSNNQTVVTFAQNNQADLTAKNIEVSLIKGKNYFDKFHQSLLPFQINNNAFPENNPKSYNPKSSNLYDSKSYNQTSCRRFERRVSSG